MWENAVMWAGNNPESMIVIVVILIIIAIVK